jgi:hypothetical protein
MTLWIIGSFMFIGGAWITVQSTTTRFGPVFALVGMGILLVKAFQ